MHQLPELRSPTGDSSLVSANYNKLSDHIRRLTPQGIQCSVFCGGNNCKYENPESWTADNLALQGIYSHCLNIKSIINLQSPREHASCGYPLESSGFSYEPNIFMESNIYYYNFAWKDYGDATLLGLLNMVKVLAFAITEGRVAVHCHAGLGRTGVLIACYLVYALRVNANDAIRYVRYKRPGSVQTRGQIICVRHFAQYILPQTIVYYIKEASLKDKTMTEFTLHRFLKRQTVALHGYDERNYKYLPKIIDKICERLLKLCGCWVDEYNPSIPFTAEYLSSKLNGNIPRHESSHSICSSLCESLLPNSEYSQSGSTSDILSMASSPVSPSCSDIGDQTDSFSELESEDLNDDMIIENKCFQKLESQSSFQHEVPSDEVINYTSKDVAEALLVDSHTVDADTKAEIKQLECDLNNATLGWPRLNVELDLKVLSCMLFDWLETLKSPILDRHNLEAIVINYKQPDICLSKLNSEGAYLIEHLIRFLSKLQPLEKDLNNFLLKRIIASLTHQVVNINNTPYPTGRGFKRFRDGTLACTFKFFQSLFELIDIDQRQKTAMAEFHESLKENSEDDSDVDGGFQ